MSVIRNKLGILVVLTILPTGFYVSGWAQPAPATKSIAIQRAGQLVRAGRADQAVSLLNSVLSSDPADLNSQLALANIYIRIGDLGKAEAEFREAFRFHPESLSASMAVAEFYIGQSSFASAEQVLMEAIPRHPDSAVLRERLAFALAAEHRYQEALANIRGVPPPLAPTARVDHFRLVASIQSGLGNRREAARAMEQALAGTPWDPQLRFLTAITEADAGEWKACFRNVAPLFQRKPASDTGLVLLRAQLASHLDFTYTLRALRHLPLPADQNVALRIRVAELLALAEKHREAADEFESALHLGDAQNPILLYNLAVEQYASAQYTEALGTALLLRQRRDSAELEDLVGDIEARTGNFSAATRDHQSAIALAPGQEKYRLSLGAVLLESQDYTQAAEIFQKAVEQFPDSARSYFGLGMADYFTEKNEESVSALIRADQLDHGSGPALSYLGATQADSGAGPSPVALNLICGRADSNPADSGATTWCGALLFRKAYLEGDQSAARGIIPRLRAAARNLPDDAVPNCQLGRALAWTQQFAEARHWLELCVRLRPDSTEDRYRLSRVYLELGLKRQADEQTGQISKLSATHGQHDAIAEKVVDEMLAAPVTSGARNHLIP